MVVERMTDWGPVVRQLNGFPRPVPMEGTCGEVEISICPVGGCTSLWYGLTDLERTVGFTDDAMLHMLFAHPVEWAESKLRGFL